LESTKNNNKNNSHFTHNSSNSSLSSHNYLLLNDSKKTSKLGDNKEEIKNNLDDINNINNRNKLFVKGTLKVDKVHYLIKDEGKKLFEDVNLQYIEPLEGGEEESEEQDDGTYRKYLNNVREELNQKQENFVFIHDLGLSNNMLNVNDLFDKIKKKTKLKTRNSFLSVYNRIKKDNVIPIHKEQRPKIIIPIKRALPFKEIKNLFVSKNELKQYLKSGKRVLTYDNRKNINNYFKIKHTLLNIRERKKAVRKINSQKLFKKTTKGQLFEEEEDDVFGNKKNNKIKDSLSLLDSSKKVSKILEEKKKEEEQKSNFMRKLEEKKKDETAEKIRSLSPKNRKKKKNVKSKEQKKRKYSQIKKSYLPEKNKIFSRKGTTSTNINKFIPDKNTTKIKTNAINSILKDIKELSQSILTNRIKRNKERKNRTILYDKHFGYEYWRENEMRKQFCHDSITTRRNKSYRSVFSTNKEGDTLSVLSPNMSWLLRQKSGEDIPDYETDFTTGIRENSFNPYSIHWTKNVIQNGYNRKIKLKNNSPGVPKIELIRVQSSMPKSNNTRVIYDKSKNANDFFRKTNNMFGRIYNNNGITFPVIKSF
jgi:hypothetical protein